MDWSSGVERPHVEVAVICIETKVVKCLPGCAELYSAVFESTDIAVDPPAINYGNLDEVGTFCVESTQFRVEAAVKPSLGKGQVITPSLLRVKLLVVRGEHVEFPQVRGAESLGSRELDAGPGRCHPAYACLGHTDQAIKAMILQPHSCIESKLSDKLLCK